MAESTLSRPERGATHVNFTVTGLEKIDTEQEFFQVYTKLVFSDAPKPSTYRGIFQSGPEALFCLTSNKDLTEVELRTQPISFEDVLKLIQWFRDKFRDNKDDGLKPDFCLRVEPYEKVIY
jgi:hypothetical protein